MSDRAPYSRVYWSVMDDPKFDGIRENPRHLGSWTLLLIVADMAWPAPAFPPPSVPKDSIRVLTEVGLVDQLSGGRFRLHGLDKERGERADSARNASAKRWQSERNAGASSIRMPSRDEPRQDEISRAEQTARESDPYNDDEAEVRQWLAKHGCFVRPGNGYDQKLVTAVAHHGTNALVGMLDRLAIAGVKDGDIKGFLFGAIDELDKRSRPNLSVLEAEDREEQRSATFAERAAATRRRNAELASAIERTDPA